MKDTSSQARSLDEAEALLERLGEAPPPPPDTPPRHSKDDPAARNAKVEIVRNGKGRHVLWSR